MTATQDEPLAVGIARAARQLDVSTKTVRRRLKAGEWKGFQIGGRWRLTTDEIRRILDGQRR
ncbi:MAG TPA: helix-turn-helix domain-containing protein [Gemmataceae bacterium]|nr:helix-turn-helix domain-containing protein [Gemmataceae bacterium]